MKRAATYYEFLAIRNEMKVQEIRSELIRTQKNWKMLNSGTEKLDHILTMGQPIINRNGIRYIDVSNNVATSSKKVCKN